ncbi:MAG TPA: FxLYD domain-containing protein [Rhodothermales bacterium]
MRKLLVLISPALLLAGCAGGDQPSEIAANEAPRVSVEEVQYQELPGGARIVTGEVLNHSDERIAHAQVQLSLYDETNTRVGSMIIAVDDIEPGESERFRSAIRSEEDVRSVKARSVLVQ